jgi:hypothetical protein
MLALDVIIVLVNMAVFALAIIYLDKRNRSRKVFKFDLNKRKGEENLEVAEAERAQTCDRCSMPVDAEKDFFDGSFWRHAKCESMGKIAP